MIHQERSREIDLPPEQVWAVLKRFMHIDEFSPNVKSVDALTTLQEGEGARRLCHFKDGSTVNEEVIDWKEGHSFRVRMESKAMPLNLAYASLGVEPLGPGRSRAYMKMDYEPKYGPVGWVMGKVVMNPMFGRVFDDLLRGLEYKSTTGISAGEHVPAAHARN